MKKIYFTLALMITNAQLAFAALDTGSDLDGALKDTTGEPGIMTIIFSLLVVVFLIYITGIIYSKLNVVGAKAAKEQFKNYDLNRAVVVSTTQLGQNRNLHVIEINERCYLIGATPNSINLIKDLGEAEKTKSTAYEKPEDADIDKAIRVLYGKDEEPVEQEQEEEFDVHKKYL